jgi:hypothetical protein
MWNSTKVQPLGDAELSITNVCTKEQHKVKFAVVPNKLTCLLGSDTIRIMNLITFNEDKCIAQMKGQGLGDLGEANLCVDPEIMPLQRASSTPKRCES